MAVNEDKTNPIDKFASFMEKNILGVKIGIYSVALCGLGLAMRSVRPFAKFTNPRQIPDHFFVSHVKLKGKFLRVEFNSKSKLIIDHYPLLLSRFRKEKGLPVVIEGIEINGNGVSWLQSVLKNKEVQFIPLDRQKDAVSCIVNCDGRNVANQLVSIGFASVDAYNLTLDKDEMYKKYYKQLLKEDAKRDRGKRLLNFFEKFVKPQIQGLKLLKLQKNKSLA